MPYPVAAVRGKILPGGFLLPYTFNPTSLPDGALPWPWLGATFAISSGAVVNLPTLGSELVVSDPGLESNYTDGKCDYLVFDGSPTCAQSADVHGGVKAQEFTATAFNNRAYFWPGLAGIAGAWYRYTCWGKRIAGSGNGARISYYQANSLPSNSEGSPVNTAGWKQYKLSYLSTSIANMYLYAIKESGSSAFDTVIVDDGSLKQLTRADLTAILPSVNRLATIKVKPSTLVDHTVSAVFLWANSADPTTFVFATWRWRGPEDYIVFALHKCVAGTYTQLIAEIAATEVADAWLEIRPVDNSIVALYYNNIQIGTNQIVSDVPGDRPGFLITGGNNVKGFFVG